MNGSNATCNETIEFLEAVWPEFTDGDPLPGTLVVCSFKPGPARVHQCRRLREASDAIEAICSEDRDVYIGVALVGNDVPRGKRGELADVVMIPGFAADVDCEKLGRSQEAAQILVEGLPLPPSVIVASGGGLHAYWLFDDPLEVTDDNRELVCSTSEGWHREVRRIAEESGYGKLDSTQDLTRVLRPAGTTNRKDDYDEPRAVAMIARHVDRRYSLKDFEPFRTEPVVGPRGDGTPSSSPPSRAEFLPNDRDNEVIAKLRSAMNGAKFEKLWDGDVDGYESESEADLALAAMLAFHMGDDPAGIERLMRQSRLLREKWSRTDYLNRTITKAIETRRDFSQGGKRSFPPTDAGNAERLVHQFGDRFWRIPLWKKTIVFDGVRWVVDHESHKMILWAKLAARSIGREASDEDGKDPRTRLLKWAVTSEGEQRLRAAVKLAAGDRLVDHATLDRHPLLLNLPNGTLDLETGILRPHDKGDLLTQLCPTPFDAAATCPRWEQFVLEVCGGDQHLVDFLQELVGLSLSGVTTEHILPILHGEGSNGKSTFVEVVMGMLGPDYGMKAAEDLLLGGGDRHPTKVADLFRKRFVACSETSVGGKLNESVVKELTGGDTVRARRMKEDYWQFDPTHKIVVCTNHKPVVEGDDDGIWRRLALVPFEQQFKGKQQDRQLGQKLLAERSGILLWALKGFLKFNVRGSLQRPTAVHVASRRYRSQEDVYMLYCEERVVRVDDEDQSEIHHKVLQDHRLWCDENGYTPLGTRQLAKRLEKDFESFKSNGKRYRKLFLSKWKE